LDKLNPVNEPIGAATIATIIAWVSAKFALGLDAGTATAIAAVVLAVAQWVARRFSTPVKKADKAITEAYFADPAKDAIPQL